MTEEDAEEWMAGSFSGVAVDRLRRFAALLIAENARHNLIAASTVPSIWVRHFVDSAQLITFAEEQGSWVDVGSGAGLPGLVIACCSDRPVTLIEPRGLRADFLRRAAAMLTLANVSVEAKKVEKVTLRQPAATISARAVARLDKLFASASHLSAPFTRWVLPKGAGAEAELVEASRRWEGSFHVERSLIDPTSKIVIAAEVRCK